MVMMEVELDSIDQPIEIPDFLKDLIIYEVTGIKEFNNSNLSR
jgi:CYTH domain-containing protein